MKLLKRLFTGLFGPRAYDPPYTKLTVQKQRSISRLSHIRYHDEGRRLTGQVMAGPFHVSEFGTTYYYVVEPDGEEILVAHDNIIEVVE